MTAVSLLGREVPSITVTDVDTDGGDLHGTGGSFDALACGRVFEFADICTSQESESIEDAAFGYLSLPFAVAGRQRFRPRCGPARAEGALMQSFVDAAEHQFGEILWFGDANWADGSGGENFNLLYLTSDAVPTTALSATDDVRDQIAQVLFDAYEAHPELDPVLHLGFQAAMRAGTDALGAIRAPYVVNPAYPVDGIAVTAGINIYVGTVQNLTHVDWPVNRRYIEGTRLGRIEFDPCLARMGVIGS